MLRFACKLGLTIENLKFTQNSTRLVICYILQAESTEE